MAKIRVLNSVGATVIIDGVERESVRVAPGTTVHWSVSKEGYVTQEGDYEVWEDTVLPVVLKREEYEITFVVKPSGATLHVYVAGKSVEPEELDEGVYKITVKYGDRVSWMAYGAGCVGQSEGFKASQSETIYITLEEQGYVITFDITPSDATLNVDGTEYAPVNGKVEITAKGGDTLSWSCYKDGYVTKSGSKYVYYRDDTVTITLEAEVVENPARTIVFKVLPNNATLTVNGEEVTLPAAEAGNPSTYTMIAYDGDVIEWSCERDGYISQSGNHIVNGDATIEITLEEELVAIPARTIVFEVLPNNATLTVNGEEVNLSVMGRLTEYGTYTMTAEDGDVIEWSCERDGYISQSGSHIVNGDATIEITLEEAYVEPAIWFERDGKKVDGISLDCSGDRIEVDVCTSRDDVMWKVDEDQYWDWGATSLYITPTSGTGPGKVTIYRDMGDAGNLSAWSVDVKFHYGLDGSYSAGTEVLSVERMECEANHLFWETHRMTFAYNSTAQQTANLYSNLNWSIAVTGDTSNALRLTTTSGSGDAEIGVTPPSFSTDTSYDYTVKATSTDGLYSDSLHVHVSSRNEQGNGITFLDGMQFKVDDQTENWSTPNPELSFRIRTWGGVTKMRVTAPKQWSSYFGEDYGLESVECNGKTLTADGEFDLEGETEYTVTVKWHNWHCETNSELGVPYGIHLEMNFDAYHGADKQWEENEVQIYTTNGETGPVS